MSLPELQLATRTPIDIHRLLTGSLRLSRKRRSSGTAILDRREVIVTGTAKPAPLGKEKLAFRARIVISDDSNPSQSSVP
jgi:hypothetical protein